MRVNTKTQFERPMISNDQLVAAVVESLSGKVGIGGGFLEGCVRINHFGEDEVFADAEVLKRSLRLRSPELVSRNIDFAEAVGFLANACHHTFPLADGLRGEFACDHTEK